VPTVHAVNSCEITPTFRVRQVQGMFDLPADAGLKSDFTVEIPGPHEDWQIGLIVGPSGSGKTTVARQAFGDRLARHWDWPTDRSLLDGFSPSLGIAEITGLLSSVGFSSPPAWVRPFWALSNGEQFRASLARALSEMPDLAVVDEFTSVVDRTVAQIGSAAVAKAVRRRNQQFVAISCHYDVLPWLQPDWILDMADGTLSRERLRRPDIELQIIRCHSSAWRIFQRHHYLSSDLNPAAKCFIGSIHSRPAAFVGVLPFPHPTCSGWREHRCVCLPDFQGLGIGNALSEFVAALFAATGKPYTSVTSHPAMMRHRARSPVWRIARTPSRCRGQSWRRLTASFRYIGPPRRELAARFGIALKR